MLGLGACTSLFFLFRHGTRGKGVRVLEAAEAYLGDVRAGRYAQAYDRLCGGNVGTYEDFAARLSAVTVTGYDLHVTFTKETLNLTSAAG